MNISLIGMSNCGKTYWSKKLEAVGFKRFGCDDIIEEKLEKELKNLGFSGINDVAKWMGQPYERKYTKTSKMYLNFEKEAMNYILDGIEKGLENKKNMVIDTTGSMIYIGETIMKRLKELTTIIFLDTPRSVIQEMFDSYMKKPKPVYWGSSFTRLGKETGIKAIKRCYPILLNFRRNKYLLNSHIKLDYYLLRKPGLSVDDFLMFVGKR